MHNLDLPAAPPPLVLIVVGPMPGCSTPLVSNLRAQLPILPDTGVDAGAVTVELDHSPIAELDLGEGRWVS